MNSENKEIMRYVGMALVVFTIMIFTHEIGHWLVFTICHWTLIDYGFYATIEIVPYGIATIPNLKIGLFDPLVAFGGVIGTLPFIHLWNRVDMITKSLILVQIVYAVFETAWWFMRGIL